MRMDCATAREALNTGAVDDAVRRHLAECALCSLGVPAGPDLGGLLAAVEADQAAERGARAWLRSQPTSRRVLLALLVAVAVSGVTVAAAARVDLGIYPARRLGVELMGLFAVTVIGAQLALWPASRRPLGWWGLIGITAGALVPVALGLAPEAHGDHPASLVGDGDFARRAGLCFLIGCLAALPVLLALRWAARGTTITRLALSAVAAGVAGIAALGLHCPITLPAHLLAGHAPVAIALAAFAAAWGWRRGHPA